MRTVLLLLATCLPLLAAPRDAQDRPNVILIFIDDMGFGDVEFNGGTKAKTPHLNRMAKEGRRFHDFYVGCAVCSGSRTALLTGCHYQRLGMKAVLFPNSNDGLHPEEVTLADMLKDAGYKTACVGKWHLGHLPPCLPTYQGFDSYYGIPYSNDMWIDPANTLAEDLVVREGLTREEVKAGHRKRNWVPLMRDEEVIEYPVDQTTVTKRYTEEAVRFITAHREKPFFLYLPHTMVHLPLAVSKAFDNPEKQLIHNAIEEVDWSVGQILQTVKDAGIAEKTLVIFTSDNGAAVGSSLPLRAKKGSVYDGGIREPTLMWWPGRIPAGSVCTEVAASIDLMPTLVNLCGGKLPDRKIDGKDISALMTGKEGARSPHDHYVLMHGPGTVRSGKWKFYPWPEGKGGKRDRREGRPSPDPVQLYDTVADIGETKNLAAMHPGIVKRLKAAYDAHVAEIKANQRPTAGMTRPAGALSPDRPGRPKKGSAAK
ncbi:MAG: sulfatase [Akkermansiaceae bacterium]|nr:sulfatase [Akkermansiaceae bacterium]